MDDTPRRPWWSSVRIHPLTISLTAAVTVGAALALVCAGMTCISNNVRDNSSSASMTSPSGAVRVPTPPPQTPLDRYAKSRGLKPVLGEVVFVTKSIYGDGGELW